MKRRESIKLLSAAGMVSASSGLFANPAGLINILQEAGYTTEKVRGNVSLFKARGGTIGWLTTPEGYAVADSQFPEQATLLINHLNTLKDQPFKFLLNTHHHGDHTAGNISFKGLTENVVAHENSKSNQEKVAKSRDILDSQLLPDTIFSDKWNAKIGDESITASYFGPAHTNGDSVIHFESSNVAHLGDLVFNRRHPYIDQSAGANIESWIRVLQKIRSSYDRDTIYLCGHSGADYDIKINADDIKAAEMYFEVLLETVQKMLNEGKSNEEILALKELPKMDWQADNLSRSINAALNELTK